jgi:adenylate cyclase
MAEERVNRKLAAILAADVVGYSRLMGVDEERSPRSSSTARWYSIPRSLPITGVSSS